jgi:GTP-binding protein
MADIPGIIEGASEGKGLGLRFLRHIERNSILLFMIPCDTKDIANEYKILLNELKKYNPDLLEKQRAVVITKTDLIDDELEKELLKEAKTKIKSVKIMAISAHNQKGIDELKDLLWKMLNS